MKQFRKQFGEEIRKLRKEHNLTQQQLGTIANITRNYICRFEKGNSLPSLYCCELMANGFGLSLRELFCRMYLPKIQMRVVETLDSFQKEFISYLPKLSHNNKKIVLEVLKDLHTNKKKERKVA